MGMKIIGRGAGTYIVEIDEGSMARAAGYESDYSEEWKARRRGHEWRCGTEFDVTAAYQFHDRVRRQSSNAKELAGTLRKIADALDGVLPEIALEPK